VLRIRGVYPGSQIPDPDFYPSRIPDLGSWIQTKRLATNFTKFKTILFLPAEEKSLGQIQRIIELLPKKLSLSSQKYEFGIRDPKKPISGPGVKKAPDPGSGSAALLFRCIFIVKEKHDLYCPSEF
jgi:hypothetical protein